MGIFDFFKKKPEKDNRYNIDDDTPPVIKSKAKEEGSWKTFYENGELKNEGNYKDGKAEGLGKTYDENGKLKAEVNFKDGKVEGKYK